MSNCINSGIRKIFISTQNSFSPPASPTSLLGYASLRDPFVPEIKEPPRNHLTERVKKRKRVEEYQDNSLIHDLKLQEHVAKLLESDDLSLLQEAIQEYAFSFKLTKIPETPLLCLRRRGSLPSPPRYSSSPLWCSS